MTGWLAAFLLTQAVETPIYASAATGSWARRLGIGLGASTLTHPLVWLFVLFVRWPGFDARVTIAEVGAVLVEAGWLRVFGVRRALGWSVLANASSVAVGALTRYLWNFP